MIDVYDLIDLVQTLNPINFPGPFTRAIDNLRDPSIEDVFDQRALAGARNAGNTHKLAERDLDVNSLEIVLSGAPDPDRTLIARTTLGWDGITLRPER